MGKLRLALAVTLGILALEAAGGFISHSLALLTDAAHMLTDVGAAALGLWAASVATHSRDHRRTFGYGRASVLAALANATALFAIVIFLGYEAIMRLARPQPIEPGIMIVFGAVALVANLLLSWALIRGERASLNVKAVTSHVLGDAAISGAVIVAAALIAWTGLSIIDPITSLLAAFAVTFSAWQLVRESVQILMEGTPEGISIPSVEQYLRENAPIEDVHDLHIWCVSDKSIAASLHVRIAAQQLAAGPDIVASVKRLLHEKYDVDHSTVEVECIDCEAAC